MSPEMKKLYNSYELEINFNPEKSDIFSFGVSFLRLILLLK